MGKKLSSLSAYTGALAATDYFYLLRSGASAGARDKKFNSPNLSAFHNLTLGANQVLYTDGSNNLAQSSLTAYARTILDDANAATARGTLGSSTVGDALFIAADAPTARSAIGAVNVAGDTISGALTVNGTFTSAGAAALSPANANVTISPTGTGTFTANPATAGTINNTSIGVTTAAAGRFTTLTCTGAGTLSPANANIAISPTGTGSVALAPATAGTINNMSVGATTASTGKFTTLTATGLADLSAAGAGNIKFPASQNASADANTLDDYVEGTFTPTIIGTSTAGAGTYSLQNGKYTKIGNVVFFNAELTWSAHTGTGNMTIGGLPYTSAAVINPIGTTYFSSITYTSGNTPTSFVNPAATTITLQQMVPASAAIAVPMDTAGTVIVSGFYFV